MKRLIFLALIGYFSICSLAQSITDFSDLVSEIVANNTSVSISLSTMKFEVDALSSTNNLSDPEVEFSHQWGQQGIGNKWGIGISQSFDWPGVYSSRKKQILAEKQALNQLHLENVRQVRLDIRCTLIDVAYYKQLISLMQEQVNRIDSLYSLYLKGAAMGEISKLDINKLKIERINVSRELNDAEISLNTCCNKLKKMNGGKDCSAIIEKVINLPNEELLSLKHYNELAFVNNPKYAYRSNMISAVEYEKELLQRSNIPGFSIGYNHDYELGEHFNGISLGLTIPIFSNKHKKAAAESRKSVLMTEQLNDEIQIKNIIETSYNNVVNLNREIGLYSSVLKDSNNIRLLDMALKSGHITLIEYLLQVNYFMDAHKYLLEIMRQKAIGMSELSQWS